MQIRLTQLLSNNNITGSDVMVTDVSGPFGYITKQATVDNLAKYITGSIVDLNLIDLSASAVQATVITASVISASTYIGIVGGGIGDVTLTGTNNFSGINTFNNYYITASNGITGSIAKFTTVTGTYITGVYGKFSHISASSATFSGSILLYGTAALAQNPEAAYIVYSSSIDKLVAFPGLFVSGALTASAEISGTIASLTTINTNQANINILSASVVSSSLIPSADSVWDLGSATNQWRDLHLSGTTIYLGGKQISVVNDSITIDGDPIVINTTASASIVTTLKTENLQTNTVSTSIFKITGNYNFATDPDKHVIFANAALGEITASIPLAASVPLRQYIFKKTDASAYGVTIFSPFETIDGASSKELLAQYETLTIISDGTGSWFVL